MPVVGITIEADSVVLKGSDFDALCALAEENNRLRQEMTLAEEGLANAMQEIEDLKRAREYHEGNAKRLKDELHRIRNDSLVWAMTCHCHCPACDALYEAIKGTASQPWQPIETAPEDCEGLFWIRPGTLEDGDWYCDTSGNPILAHVAPHIHMGKRGTWSSLMRATHWMPKPSPPHPTTNEKQS